MAAPKKPNRVRVELTPPDGEVLSVWADRDGNRFTLVCDLDVSPGWHVKGNGFSGPVTAVDGRTLTCEV